MNIYIKLFYISGFLLFVSNLTAQILITNRSFEGKPADATMPSGWFMASEGTTPDILPGYWGVYNEPLEGDTYIGLITRQDGSFESITQRMENGLQKGTCYSLTFALSHSDNYAGYSAPLKIMIWIGDKKSDRQQKVFESALIKGEEWRLQKIDFTPTKNMEYIIIEAFNSRSAPVNGNILIDALSNPNSCNRV